MSSVNIPDITINALEVPKQAPEEPLITNTIYATVYAYSSEVNQTDSDPFTTADGSRVKKGIVANNCLEFGTRVIIRGEIYEVHDRMHSRYDCSTFDIWMKSKEEAKNWGKKYLEVIIK